MFIKFIKICGIRNTEDLKLVERYADATGVVVECKSKRRINLEEAKNLVELAEIPVFVVSTLSDFNSWSRVIEATNANFIQIHTDLIKPESVEKIKSEFGVFIMKAFRVPKTSRNPAEDAEDVIERIEQFEIDRILLDTGRGSGLTHDHRVSKLIADKFDVVLAGGLNPENLAEIIEFVKPFGVDVSSGVEKNGKKDENLIKEFVSRVKLLNKVKNKKVK
ncbi:MAG: phosphoribosylanthranilate isomerase [Archaeoglobus sp.]|nr:MAG: phosphoribosylanthranilate isomerase [Archaeoglobus sp.]